MTLIAALHEARSGALHLRVAQTSFSERAKQRLRRIGSPAIWMQHVQSWDCPLTPAAVIALDEAARDLGEEVQWDARLQDYAKQHIQQSDYEHQVRLAIERVIRGNDQLEAYMTRTVDEHHKPCPPMRHQQISYHWSQRSAGLLLAHDPGCIDGEAIVVVSQRGVERTVMLASLFRAMRFDQRFGATMPPFYTKSLAPDGSLVDNRIIDVLDRGVRPVLKVRTRQGLVLYCTPDHEIATWEKHRSRVGIEWVKASDLRYGQQVYTRRAHYTPVDEVLSVEPNAGERHVYDIVMADPHRSFVADGVVVHNCGKTRSAADASGGWYRNGIIRPMTPTLVPTEDGQRQGVEGGVLVVAPKTVLLTWQRELSFWQNANGLIIIGSAQRKQRLAATPAHYHLVNYEGLRYVVHNRYDAVILDEVHRVANATNQTDYCLQIAQRTRRRLGLSGTPISNKLESIFYPMLIIDGGRSLGPSRTAFLETYFRSVNVNGMFTKHEPTEDAVKRVSAAISKSTYFVSKNDPAVALNLPEKTHTPIFLPMTDEQQRYYQQIKSEAVTYIQDIEVSAEQAAARMMKLLQICQGFALETETGKGRHFSDAKTEALVDALCDQYVNKKVIVWAYFQYEIQRLCDTLRERGVEFARVDGTVTSQRDRDAMADRWNADPTLKVFVRQLSMSEGVTLTAKDCAIPCHDNIYLALSYRYVDWKQSQDRIHRIGQRWPCSYTYLLTETGVDRRVYDVVLEKDGLASDVQQTTKDYYLKLLKD